MKHLHDHRSQQHANAGADDRQQERFAHDHRGHLAGFEAERFQRRVFGKPLTRGHRHCVGRHRHDDQDDDVADAFDRRDDRFDHRNEAQRECFLGFGQRFGQRVFELRVDRARDIGRRRPFVDPDNEHAREVRAATRRLFQLLVQIVIVKVHLARDRRFVFRVVDRAHVEFPVAGINAALQRNRVAELEAIQIG